MKSLFPFIILFAISFTVQAQFGHLPLKLQKSIERQWYEKTSQVVLKKEGEEIAGQIIYHTDSGLIWRNGPQYLPYSRENVSFIPFNEVDKIQIRQPWRMGNHLVNGALTGGFLYSSLNASMPYDGYGSFFYNRRFYFYRVRNFVMGALCGAVIGAIRSSRAHKDYDLYFDQKGKSHLFYLGQIKQAALYSSQSGKNRVFVAKDSILTGMGLPDELHGLKPLKESLKLEVSIGQGITDLWGKVSISPPLPEISDIGFEIYSRDYYTYKPSTTPHFYEIRALYRFTPWLKAGIQTHKIVNDTNRFATVDPVFWANLGGSRIFNHGQSWGAVTELTPLPTRFLALRRWDMNLGGGVFTQNLEIVNQVIIHSFGQTSEQTYTKKYHYWGALAYGGITFHLFPNISLQTKLGKFYAPSISESEMEFEGDPLSENILFAPVTYRLSWNYYSFGLNVKI
ncbi:MAG: hypothetical protein KDD99_03375 [Bacteroidetes bacterium]|nr:hypothetical protein [Bacteroidota bacterium]